MALAELKSVPLMPPALVLNSPFWLNFPFRFDGSFGWRVRVMWGLLLADLAVPEVIVAFVVSAQFSERTLLV